MATHQKVIVALRDALLKVFEEHDKEEKRPDSISFPNPEWNVFMDGSLVLIYKRNETASAIEQLQKAVYGRRD